MELKLTKIDEFNYDAGGKPEELHEVKINANSANYAVLAQTRMEYLQQLNKERTDELASSEEPNSPEGSDQ